MSQVSFPKGCMWMVSSQVSVSGLNCATCCSLNPPLQNTVSNLMNRQSANTTINHQWIKSIISELQSNTMFADIKILHFCNPQRCLRQSWCTATNTQQKHILPVGFIKELINISALRILECQSIRNDRALFAPFWYSLIITQTRRWFIVSDKRHVSGSFWLLSDEVINKPSFWITVRFYCLCLIPEFLVTSSHLDNKFQSVTCTYISSIDVIDVRLG